MRLSLEKLEMKTLAELIRVFELCGASGRANGDFYKHGGQLQLKASDLGHCAVYEKELQRVWPITEENRRAKIAEFGEKHGFRLAYYKTGHCAIFLHDSASSRQIAAHSKGTRLNRSLRVADHKETETVLTTDTEPDTSAGPSCNLLCSKVVT